MNFNLIYMKQAMVISNRENVKQQPKPVPLTFLPLKNRDGRMP